MRRWVLLVLFFPAAASAQTFGLDDSWSRYPQTPAVSLVKAAISNGFCEQPAVDFINSFHQVPAAFVPAGSASLPSGTIQWYAKGSAHCDGKFQFTSPDGPYGQGWEIRFNPSTWVNGQPTQWQIHPFAEPTDGIPPPPPVVTPPAPTLDLSAVLKKLDELEADDRSDQQQLLQKLDDLSAKIDEPGWFKKTFSNPYVQGVLVAIGTCASTQCWKAKQ